MMRYFWCWWRTGHNFRWIKSEGNFYTARCLNCGRLKQERKGDGNG